MSLPDTPSPVEPGPSEPTVLDFFKSVTRDWNSFFNFLGSLVSVERREAVERGAAEQAELAAHPVPLPIEPETPAVAPAAALAAVTFPWRAVGAITLALFAQLMLEPPRRQSDLAIGLYIFALALALWSYFAGEWRLTPLRAAGSSGGDPLTLRLLPLLLSAALSVMAFLALGDDLFTWTNLALWLAAVGCFLWAMWLRRPSAPRAPLSPEARRKALLWAALVVAVFGLGLFFRLNRVAAIPNEPFSDHAEKLWDVYEITLGKTLIFFPRNTGREAFQMYWTLLMAKVFGTGFSFLSLKLGTTLLGVLTLPYIYLLGRELGGPRLGLIALFLVGISYWLNVIARIGLRFPLYPLFTAPVLYYLLHGLRTRDRNDFLLAGLAMGIGLHGYTPFRIVPLAATAAVAIYLIHPVSKGVRRQAVWWLALSALVALIVFLPLLRYAIDNPEAFNYRALTRMGTVESPLPGPPVQIFLSNMWKGLGMFNWDDGQIWVNSIPHRPALDVVTGALFLIGAALLVLRYLRGRDWRDLFLLLSIPILILPSVMSLAFPDENPALNRTGGAAIPVILIASMALEGLVQAFGAERKRRLIGWGLAGLLLAASAYQNYDLVFRVFNQLFRDGSWNTSEMGQVITDFRLTYGEDETVWIVPYPYWVDTRLPPIWAGIPERDIAMFKENLGNSLGVPAPKLFMYKPEDTETENILKEMYPQGVIRRYTSAVNSSKDFMIFLVEK